MSESESFGIVLLEAWMSERPVIANRGTLAFSELVEDGTDGLLVREPAELADAMRRLASDPKLAAGMGRNGRDKAETYSWARLAVILRETLAAASDPPSTGGKARSKEST
jgi:glycosyltransferase involved in cell wall biosynthesis